jgi:uncharacterized SAM-binding protein YcdF (DUF218 family)
MTERQPRVEATPRRRGAAALGSFSLLLALALWASGFAWFVGTMPDRVPDPRRHTDAIVALTGGAARLEEAFLLLASGVSDRLLITGVHRDVDVDELLRLTPGVPRELATSIELGYEAPDTAGNAAETASWVRRHGFRSIRLVTAFYHLPRSLFEFRRAMPDVEIVPNPVFPPVLHDGKWWQRPATLSLVVMEYNKYLVARLRHAFEAAAAGGG